jgi:hypothetical protein
MAYLLEEQGDDGSFVILGDPIFDLKVATVVAARRASRSRQLTVVRDQATGVELARFDGSTYVPTRSDVQMKAMREVPTATLTRRKIG